MNNPPWLREREHVGWIGQVKHGEHGPPPAKGADVYRLRVPALLGSLDDLADAPVLERLVSTGLDRNRDLSHNPHDYPPSGARRRPPSRTGSLARLTNSIREEPGQTGADQPTLSVKRCRAAYRDTPRATAIRFQLRPRARAAASRSVTRASSRRTW
jgi:hypothetical protein